MNYFTFLAWAAATIGAAVSVAAPTTAPSQTPPAIVNAGQASYSSVLVLPFSPLAGASPWIGNAVQDDLATELTRQSRLDVMAPIDARAVSDAATASNIGRDKGASLVAFGTYQIVESNVRMNGQLIDTSTGKPLAALKTTGPERALFYMEDQLAAQAIISLPPALIKPRDAYISTNTAAPSTVPSGNEASGPYNSQGFYVTPGPDYLPSYDYTGGSAPAATYDNSYAPSAYPNDYPWYDPFWADDFFFLGGFGDRRHDHDHGRNGGSEFHTPPSSSANGTPAFHNSPSSGGFHTAGGFHDGGMRR